jgi:hypothetical protein
LDSPILHLHEYGLAFLEDDSARMSQQIKWATGKAGIEDAFLAVEANTEGYLGRLARSRELTNRAITIAQRADDKEGAADHQAMEALQDALYGNAGIARREATAALAFSNSREAQPIAATALALAGEVTHADSLAADLHGRYPEDTLQNFKYVPTIRAAAEVSRKNPSKAIEILQPASFLEFGETGSFSGYPVFVRGEAYLLEQKGGEAAKEFQKILDHRGIVLNEPIAALAHLQIGRAFAMEGDIAKAHSAYQDFFTLWKDADADIPILRQAKTEYAKLQLRNDF